MPNQKTKSFAQAFISTIKFSSEQGFNVAWLHIDDRPLDTITRLHPCRNDADSVDILIEAERDGETYLVQTSVKAMRLLVKLADALMDDQDEPLVAKEEREANNGQKDRPR